MVSAPPKTSTDAIHVFTSIPLVSDQDDAMKSAFYSQLPVAASGLPSGAGTASEPGKTVACLRF